MALSVRKFVDGLYEVKTADGKIIGRIRHKPELNKRYRWSAYYYPQGYDALKKAADSGKRTINLIESNMLETKKLAVEWIKRRLAFSEAAAVEKLKENL